MKKRQKSSGNVFEELGASKKEAKALKTWSNSIIETEQEILWVELSQGILRAQKKKLARYLKWLKQEAGVA